MSGSTLGVGHMSGREKLLERTYEPFCQTVDT
jgi:hypothetical protein